MKKNRKESKRNGNREIGSHPKQIEEIIERQKQRQLEARSKLVSR